MSQRLWDSWSWKQKLVWLWKIKLRFGRKEIEHFEAQKEVLAEACLLITARGEDIDSIIKSWEKKFKKYWYEANPKNIIVANISFQPLKPAEFIEVDFLVGRKESPSTVAQQATV